jgi:hypothetical protein
MRKFIKNTGTDDFINALKEVEPILASLSFIPHSLDNRGFACYAEYKNGNNIVMFMYGAPEWHIDIELYIANKKYEFKDLIENTNISEWINKNRYLQENGRKLQNEMLWFIELLKVSLSILC